MASVVYEDENSDENSFDCLFSALKDENQCNKTITDSRKNVNLVNNLINRQLYGRITKHPKAKTEKIFDNIHPKCKIALSSLIRDPELNHHVFMGFSICGQYFISYTEKMSDDLGGATMHPYSYEYELYLWRFSPGVKLKFESKYRIFKQASEVLDKVMVMQFPLDAHKIVCYGLAATNPELVYITIITIALSQKRCRHCVGKFTANEDSVNQGWCAKHGFIIHYMFSMSHPSPAFDPKVSLAFPDHLIINTGYHIHILNVNTSDPTVLNSNNVLPHLKDVDEVKLPNTYCLFNDSLSEVSESPSEHFESNSIVDAILDDLSEYDMESNDCNKPFHELNISCEPLNVTGKSYHNTLVQNIVDPRMKQRLQHSGKEYLFSVPHSSNGIQKNTNEKSKIDKKIAEKAYEFIEENEKCEKLSSFRKKRLADKKYEFSEDNSENIVPFNSLRRERRYLYRSTQNRCIRSPDFNSLFLSPRSPMQSPNSRNNGQFSPGGARNLYCPSIRNSPHHSKSPISPKESARKFYVYSPSLDSDCSDSDSRLILRNNGTSSVVDKFNQSTQGSGLLIMAPKSESPKWIKKIVRRYTNCDFENSSLVSGQSRDDYNNPIEIPLLVQNLTESHFDIVPDFKVDQLTEMQLILTQRSFDCEHFIQRRAQTLCSEAQLEFLHCEDYDIKIIHVCPVSGQIFCKAVIKIGALQSIDPYSKPDTLIAHFLFAWSIVTDACDVIESKWNKLLPPKEYEDIQNLTVPPTNFNDVVVMDYNYVASKTLLRDYHNYFEVCLGSPKIAISSRVSLYEEEDEMSSDSD